MPVSLRCSATGSWWAFSAALLAACSGPPYVRVGRIVIDAPRSFDAAPAARETIRRGVEALLADERTATYAPNERDSTHVLHLRIGELGADEERPATRPRYRMQVRLRPLGSAALYETTAAAEGDDPAAAVLAGFRDAWGVLGHQRQLDAGSERALIAALGDADPRIRDFATIRLGDRKSRDAVLPLCERLQKEPRPELVLRAIGALVSIGDPRAVGPIIELSKSREPDFVLQIVYAVGAIGGRTAEAYLVTLASGHPVEAVRRGAEEALAEMKKGGPGKR